MTHRSRNRNTSVEYFQKAEENRSLSRKLSREVPVQRTWALVVAFYSAVHYVNAYAAKYNFDFQGHKARNQEIEQNPVFDSVRDDWGSLSEFGWNARYTCRTYSHADYDECRDALERFRSALEPLIQR